MSGVFIDSVKVKFGDFEALRGITLTIESGNFVTLLGPSGCGKTTLLKTIAGFTPPFSGKILIDGKEIHNLPPEKRDTAMCFQSYALFPHLSVANNLLFGPKQKKIPKGEQKILLQEVSAQMSLTSQLEKFPPALSGGQQQRVALGRALAIKPGVILFDEPLSNLDAKLRDSVRFEIRQLQRQQNFTAIYVTHDQAEALAMSDIVVVMNQGVIQQIGTPHEIYYYPINRFVADFIGAANILKATVIEQVNENTYQILTILGELRVETNSKPIAKKTYIFWRPEDTIFRSSTFALDANTIKLNILTKTFLGNLTEFSLSTETNSKLNIRAQCLGFHPAAEGEQTNFHIPANRIRFLAEEHE